MSGVPLFFDTMFSIFFDIEKWIVLKIHFNFNTCVL